MDNVFTMYRTRLCSEESNQGVAAPEYNFPPTHLLDAENTFFFKFCKPEEDENITWKKI